MIGIYRIDGPGGKVYIGSSVDISKRWHKHKRDLRNNKHCSPKLQNSWNKYCEMAFKFSVIEEIIDGRVVENNGKTKLINREQLWLNILLTSLDIEEIFNTSFIAGSPLGVTRSEDTKRKLRDTHIGKLRGPHTEEHKRKIGDAQKGKSISEETRNKLSKSLKGRVTWNKGKTLSDEHRQKLSDSHKGKICAESTKIKMRQAHKNRINHNV